MAELEHPPAPAAPGAAPARVLPPGLVASAGRHSYRLVYPVVLATVLVWASGNNPAAIPGTFVGFDKVAHFCVFGLLATNLLRLESVWRRPGWRAWIAIGVVSFFGASDEWHQSFTPGRAVEFADWLADTSGAALAVTLYLRWGWYRRLLEMPLRGWWREPASARAPAAAAAPATIGRE